jgi:fructokinase
MDYPGSLIHRFLLKNNVSTEHVCRYDDGKTAIALAYLDDRQDAAYSFYRIYPQERLTLDLPSVQSGDIVLFGSFYSLTASLRPKITEFLHRARSGGAFIIYDPNFRTSHSADLETMAPWIRENISMADIVRGSDEDFLNIYGVFGAQQAFQHVQEAGCSLLVYTRNSRGVEVVFPDYSISFPVPQILPVSTIGAGDAFNAGIIYSLCNPEGPETLTGPAMKQMIHTAIRFSENVCLSLDNYISYDFADRLK